MAHLDRTSLAPVGPELPLPAEPLAAPSTEAARVVLSDGRSIVCWRSGDFERGYRVMARAWTGGGEPIGAAVPISPADSDVFGAPQIVSVDGDHAVAAFAVVGDDRAEVLAVSLQVPCNCGRKTSSSSALLLPLNSIHGRVGMLEQLPR